MIIKEMCEAERPREKMLLRGPGALSDGELIAILLRTGTRRRVQDGMSPVPVKGSGADSAGGKDDSKCGAALLTESALDIARRLLSEGDGKLVNLFNMSADRLCTVPGIGKDKACALVAAFELGRRFIGEKSTGAAASIVSSRMVYDIMLPKMKGLVHEECWAMFLAPSNQLMSLDRINVGDIGSTVVDVSKIIRMAIEKAARGIILIHNHPSSNPHPSEEDIRQTSLLKEMSASCGLMLLDHVIVGSDSFFSFADERAE